MTMTVSKLALLAGVAAAAVSIAGSSTTAAASVGPCDWVTANEAADLLGGPVSTQPQGAESDSVEMSCGDSRGPGEDGVTSDLRLPGAFPDGAVSLFALATTPENATSVDGVGIEAACVSEPMTTPPSTTLVVLLSEDRIYRATGWHQLSCDTLKSFAQNAIGRIGEG